MSKIKTKTNDLQLSHELINAAVWGNSYDFYNTLGTVGFKTHSFRHAALSPVHRIAEDFLISSRLLRYDHELTNSVEMYLEDAGKAMLSLLGDENTQQEDLITLPESTPLQMTLGSALQQRRSVRRYEISTLPLADLAAVVRAATGITASQELAFDDDSSAALNFRTAPSSGALYPIDLFIAVMNVANLANGIYRYHPKKDKLTLFMDDKSIPALLRTHIDSAENKSYSRANAIFLLIGQPWRCMRKYGSRGMRFVLQECGAISQNINLAACALKLGSVECGGFYDDEVNKVLGLDGIFRTFIHAVVVGTPE